MLWVSFLFFKMVTEKKNATALIVSNLELPFNPDAEIVGITISAFVYYSVSYL